MKKLIILPGLIVACVFLTGCLGLVVAHPRQKCTEQFCLGNRGVVSNSPAATPLTEAKVLELWGQPNAKRIETNAVTVWQYQGKMGWTIVVPAYIFALPLPIPVGHKQVELYFKDGIAQKASRSVPVFTGAFIGIPVHMLVFAWEKEEDTNKESAGVLIGYGFVETNKPVQA